MGAIRRDETRGRRPNLPAHKGLRFPTVYEIEPCVGRGLGPPCKIFPGGGRRGWGSAVPRRKRAALSPAIRAELVGRDKPASPSPLALPDRFPLVHPANHSALPPCPLACRLIRRFHHRRFPADGGEACGSDAPLRARFSGPRSPAPVLGGGSLEQLSADSWMRVGVSFIHGGATIDAVTFRQGGHRQRHDGDHHCSARDRRAHGRGRSDAPAGPSQ